MFDLPDHGTLYEALCARDPSYEGRAFVCVATTGIFCRLTCPARKPKPENCSFESSIGACIEAGFRPCKRCHPLGPAAKAEPVIARLLAALEDRPDHRWREGDIAAMGIDPSTVRRLFKRHYGMTFLEMARQKRLRAGFVTLGAGGAVIEAQIDAGFASGSAFREAFARLLGHAPAQITPGGMLQADWIETPLGSMLAVGCATHLHLLEFIDRKALPRELAQLETANKTRIGLGAPPPIAQLRGELEAFFAGRSARFTVPLAPMGSAFARQVWDALRTIPPGTSWSYRQLAEAIGRPTAMRAVARANGANRLALVIPCHRVIGADGTLTGYGGGLWRKQKLLELEQAFAS